MIEKKRRCAAFAVCGSFCTLEAALDAARALRGQGWELLPVMSFAAGDRKSARLNSSHSL